MKIKILLLNFITIIFFLPNISFANYSITVNPQKPFIANVLATIPVKHGKIQMANWGASQFPNGWAYFITDLVITTVKGKTIKYDTLDNANWILSDTTLKEIKLTYSVDLSFSKEEWIYGNEQAALFQDEALYTVSKTLFIYSDTSISHTITFNLPNEWKIATPWQKENNSFITKTNDELINNSIVMGKFSPIIFSSGKFNCIIVLLGDMKKSNALVEQVMKKVLDYYTFIFPNTPSANYLMTVFQNKEPDAEGFLNSNCFSENESPSKENIVLWGNTLAHEIFHSWNGNSIIGQDYPTSQWFSEGFTEYFATCALLNSDFYSKDFFLKKMENNFGLYAHWRWNGAFAEFSIKDAGLKKSKNKIGIYNGGWTAAFCLDVLIRENTNNKKSLADLMRQMYSDYGLTGEKYSYNDIIKTVNSIADKDLSNFFKKYIEGKEIIPLEEYCSKAGLNCYTYYYNGEVFLSINANLTPLQGEIQKSILSQ